MAALRVRNEAEAEAGAGAEIIGRRVEGKRQNFKGRKGHGRGRSQKAGGERQKPRVRKVEGKGRPQKQEGRGQEREQQAAGHQAAGVLCTSSMTGGVPVGFLLHVGAPPSSPLYQILGTQGPCIVGETPGRPLPHACTTSSYKNLLVG